MNKTHNNQKPTETLAESVFERIEKEDKKPLPKWHFVLKNQTFWGLWVLSVLIGAAAVAGTIFGVSNAGWRYRLVTHETSFQFFIESLPIIWIISLVIFIIIGYQNFKHTKKGYKYSLTGIVIISIITSAVGGAALYAFGLGKIVDENIGQRIPFHKSAAFYQQELWVNPEEGFLAGTVIEVDTENDRMLLETFDGEEWVIRTIDLRTPDIAALSEFGEVRVVGLPATTTEFHACFVLPWEIAGKGPKFFGENAKEKPAPPFGMSPKNFSERNFDGERSNECKGVRPYDILQALQNN